MRPGAVARRKHVGNGNPAMTVTGQILAVNQNITLAETFLPDAAEPFGNVCFAVGVDRLRKVSKGRVLHSGPGIADDGAQSIDDRTHATPLSAAPALMYSRIRRAATLAGGPVSPIGPTHPGQPCSQSHVEISSRVRERS